MSKILEGLKEAVKIASCDHDLVLFCTRETPSTRTWIYVCNDCKAVIHKPQKMWGDPRS